MSRINAACFLPHDGVRCGIRGVSFGFDYTAFTTSDYKDCPDQFAGDGDRVARKKIRPQKSLPPAAPPPLMI